MCLNPGSNQGQETCTFNYEEGLEPSLGGGGGGGR